MSKRRIRKRRKIKEKMKTQIKRMREKNKRKTREKTKMMKMTKINERKRKEIEIEIMKEKILKKKRYQKRERKMTSHSKFMSKSSRVNDDQSGDKKPQNEEEAERTKGIDF